MQLNRSKYGPKHSGQQIQIWAPVDNKQLENYFRWPKSWFWLYYLDQFSILDFQSWPDFNDELFRGYCILGPENLISYLLFGRNKYILS